MSTSTHEITPETTLVELQAELILHNIQMRWYLIGGANVFIQPRQPGDLVAVMLIANSPIGGGGGTELPAALADVTLATGPDLWTALATALAEHRTSLQRAYAHLQQQPVLS